MELDELNQQVDKYSENLKARRRENYRYARDKGFTPKQAMILAGKNKDEIDKLAAERDNGQGGSK
ncbi:MAG: hypothetical protein WC365_03615 [Candidatus Babeliales bacterium]|jgi:hypothetical protein